MKREIKFRAWNIVTKTMIDLKKITPLALNMDTDGLFLPFSDGLPLMQFTGLKDKNGKEIWEGDIVDCDDQHRLVKWGSQNAGFYMAHTRGIINFRKDFIECGQSQSDGPVHCDTCEVIGNLYQNPELLK